MGMHHIKAVAAASAALVAATVAVTAAPAQAASVRTVTVRMSDAAITFHGGGATTENGVTTLRPGRYTFHVVSKSGGHALQLIRFQNGYTADQAQKDFGDAFNGDVAAVQRIDNGVVFLAGAGAAPKHPSDMGVTLPAGQLAAIDQNGDAMAPINVTGTRTKSAAMGHRGRYTSFTYGWGVSKRLPASGTVTFANQSDQPHFLVIQRVKSSTTNAKVRRYVKSGLQQDPPWALKASTSSGVVSAGKRQLLSYDLPAGKYVIACFWPDYFTGMPHIMMGMWKLVRLS